MILDASVVLKWYLPDENLSSSALGLLDQYVSGEIEILAPSLLEYKVINGLMIAQKRGRIKETIILEAVKGFINLGIKYHSLTPLYPKTIQLTQKYDISFYDASYLGLAHKEKTFLITADNRLLKACEKDFKWIKQL
ncbi:MAG TPA: type II toxin-antitoxin system VapC family toxin [Acidobacteriota bacterium]|nr:type II toxin-antitoxin system VapC family toxin [Acidobacteriota bacterium]